MKKGLILTIGWAVLALGFLSCADPVEDGGAVSGKVLTGSVTIFNGEDPVVASPEVGDQLSVDIAELDKTVVADAGLRGGLVFEWLRDTESIKKSSENSYVVTEDDVGKHLTVKVIHPSYVGWVYSKPTPQAVSRAGIIITPAISRVSPWGRYTFTAKDGSGTELPVTWSIIDGPAGVDQTSFTATTITIQVDYTAPASAQFTIHAVSSADATVTGDRPLTIVKGAVTVEGTKRVGETLRAKLSGTYGTVVSWRWLWQEDGTQVGAPSPKSDYLLQSADETKYMVAEVTTSYGCIIRSDPYGPIAYGTGTVPLRIKFIKPTDLNTQVGAGVTSVPDEPPASINGSPNTVNFPSTHTSITAQASFNGAAVDGVYRWYLNGTLYPGGGSSITISVGSLSTGNHTIAVTALVDAVPYSAQTEFTVGL